MAKTIVRSIYFAIIFVIGVILMTTALNGINKAISANLPAFENRVDVSEIENRLTLVENTITENGKATLRLYSDDHERISVCIDRLEFGYTIDVNNETIIQNKDITTAGYDSGYAYQIVEISPDQYIDNKVSLTISGNGAGGVDFYLAKVDVMNNAVEIRTICYAMMLISLIFIAIASIIIYIQKRNAFYYLLFALSASVSVIKSLNAGDLFVFAQSLGLTFENYLLINQLTSNINMLIPILIMLNLMGISIDRRWKIGISIPFLMLMTFTFIPGTNMAYQLLLLLIIVFNIGLSVYGCVKKKPFCHLIFANNALFLSFLFYDNNMFPWHLNGGNIDFYINPPYLGSILCLFLFLLAFIKNHLLHTKQLEEKQREFERISLLRGIGHDLKLPLSVIKASNQMLLKYELGEEKQQEYAKMSLEAAQELEKMTSNISSFLSLSHTVDKNTATSLKDLFEKAKRHYEAYAGAIGHSFTATWEGNDTVFPIQPLQLERMLYNLLDNAFKYSPSRSEVRLSCRVNKKNAEIKIADDGIGMEQAQFQQIFDPFYRGQTSRTENGLGLGLSVVKGIVDELNGTIQLESVKDKGSTFTVILPLS